MKDFIIVKLIEGISVHGLITGIDKDGIGNVIINKNQIISFAINHETYEISILLAKVGYVVITFNNVINEFYRIERELTSK